MFWFWSEGHASLQSVLSCKDKKALHSFYCVRLKKRGLSWEKFQQLVKGKLPIVPAEIATRYRTNMLRGGELEALMGPMDRMQNGGLSDMMQPR